MSHRDAAHLRGVRSDCEVAGRLRREHGRERHQDQRGVVSALDILGALPGRPESFVELSRYVLAKFALFSVAVVLIGALAIRSEARFAKLCGLGMVAGGQTSLLGLVISPLPVKPPPPPPPGPPMPPQL